MTSVDGQHCCLTANCVWLLIVIFLTAFRGTIKIRCGLRKLVLLQYSVQRSNEHDVSKLRLVCVADVPLQLQLCMRSLHVALLYSVMQCRACSLALSFHCAN